MARKRSPNSVENSIKKPLPQQRKQAKVAKPAETLESDTHKAEIVPSPFTHPSEVEFARILDFYGVKSLYEPQSFPFRWDMDKIVEMFTPDFYLPDFDLDIELTTLKQSLVTEKNRKLGHLKELYPDVNIKLLYKRDYHRILAKYGYGPLAQDDTKGIDHVMFSTNQIQKRVSELGREHLSLSKSLPARSGSKIQV